MSHAEETDGEGSPTGPSLEPLRCPSCGAPVPLGDAEVSPCPHCAARVDIPPAYRALRDAARAGAQAREELEAAYRRIGAPPGFVLRVWGTAAGGLIRGLATLTWAALSLWKWAFAGILRIADLLEAPWLVSLAALPALLLLAALWDFLGMLRNTSIGFGFDVFSLVPAWLGMGLLGLALVLGSALPSAVVDYLGDFVDIRRRVQAGLSAAPPAKPGGPACCRTCGGALEVPEGALGVRCLYCRADNLVAVSAAWVEGAERWASGRLEAAVEACEEEQRVRAAALAAARRRLLLSLTVPVGLGAFGGCIAWASPDEFHGGWSAAAAGERTLAPAECTSFAPLFNAAVSALLDEKPEGPDCPSSNASLHFALHRGEPATLTLTGAGAASPRPGPSVPVVRHLCGQGILLDLERCDRPLGTLPAEGTPSIRFSAPSSGWYRLDNPGDPSLWRLEVQR